MSAIIDNNNFTKNKLYYHFFIPNTPSSWDLLLYEQLDCIEGSLLHQHCEIEICISSNRENYRKLQKILKSYSFLKSTWFNTSIENNKNYYEGITLLKLYDECDSYNNVGYIHSKGITNLTKNTNKWRKALEYAVIERYQDNFDALEGNCDVSGIFFDRNNLFFAGNFWWAKSSYIRTLPRPIMKEWNSYEREDIFVNKEYNYMLRSNRHRYELWIGLNKPKVNDIHILSPMPIFYNYELNIKRQTLLSFKKKENLSYD